MSPAIITADYRDPAHGAAIVQLMDAYACDPMGGGAPLSDYARANLPAALAQVPGAVTLLCQVEGQMVGLMTALPGFSTFRCRPLLNIHDVVVLPAYRGRGCTQMLLAALEAVARARGCCKLTLEVLEGNVPARRAYTRFGFSGYELDPAMGKALFWEKPLLP
jgi:GNAT superfamily N-acetyltransferase